MNTSLDQINHCPLHARGLPQRTPRFCEGHPTWAGSSLTGSQGDALILVGTAQIVASATGLETSGSCMHHGLEKKPRDGKDYI